MKLKNIEQIKERNIGIDLLKILAMIMIVTHHILEHGGILQSAEFGTFKYYFLWYLQIICLCAVNCYAMASGFLLYNGKFKFSRILNLYLQVITYSVIILVIFYILKPSVISKDNLFASIFPFSFNSYWYFTSYIPVAFLFPFFNKLIDILPKKQFEYLLIFCFFVFSALPTIIGRDILQIVFGFSATWLIALYFLGAYIKKYKNEFRPKFKYILYFFLSVTSVWILKYFMDKTGINIFNNNGNSSDYLLKYTSPFILAMAISLFMFCINIKPKGELVNKIIIVLSAATFGVYIIHINILIKVEILSKVFIPYMDLTTGKLFLVIIVGMIIIYTLCTIIEEIRIKLFKILKVYKLTSKVDKYSDEIFYNKTS